jgi:hypothetical protein
MGNDFRNRGNALKKQTPIELLVCVLIVWVAASQAQVRPVAAEWPRFRDEAHGVSFAYPPELHPVIAPAENLRLDGWVSRVSLLADDAGGVGKLAVFTVDVFICDDPGLDPRVPCQDESFYRKVCDRFEKLPVGDGVGIQCVTYGRAACSWSVVVLREKGRVQISAPAADRAANLKTTDRAACADGVVVTRTQPPLKEVLTSFRFRRAE